MLTGLLLELGASSRWKKDAKFGLLPPVMGPWLHQADLLNAKKGFSLHAWDFAGDSSSAAHKSERDGTCMMTSNYCASE
jgi:hypothetical protein